MRVEVDGGHTVPISLATSLNSKVQAGGDPWQVVRGCQKVVAHLDRELRYFLSGWIASWSAVNMQGSISSSSGALL